MAKGVLTNCRIFSGGVDLTGVSNKVAIDVMAEKKDTTCFGADGWKSALGGLKSATFQVEGFWEAGAGTVDAETYPALGDIQAISVYPSQNETYAQSADYGTTVYFTDALRASYQQGDKVGEVAPFKLDVDSSWPGVRGVGIHPPGTARTATGNGTAVLHAAVPAGSYLYAALHVLSVSGTGSPTLTVKVQSDTVGFPSPTDQITFAAATAIGEQISRVAGAITDTYYRVSYVISGTNPSFLFTVSLGIA